MKEDTASLDYLADIKKELKKRGLQRDTRFGVGKRMGPNVYFHRQYAGDVIKKNPEHFKFFKDLLVAHRKRKADEIDAANIDDPYLDEKGRTRRVDRNVTSGAQQAAFNSRHFLDFNIIKYNTQTGDIFFYQQF